MAEILLDFKGSSVSLPVFITVSKVLYFSSHESLFPIRRPKLTSWRYFEMAKHFVGLKSLDLRIVFVAGEVNSSQRLDFDCIMVGESKGMEFLGHIISFLATCLLSNFFLYV